MTTARKAWLALALAFAAAAAHGERADSLQKVVVQADHVGANFVDGSAELTGNVVLTRGTLILKAARAVMREDDQGYKFATFFAAPGGKATFRQKRDGGPDLWSEGEAERIEYDGKNEVVKLFSKARVASLTGTRVTQQAEGPFISYDSRREDVKVFNTADGTSKAGGGRVTLIYDNHPKTPPAAEQGKK
ncbi:MAG TPA: lipopolysaccharide transport periplasmic protein LptA [Telluria sp.]|nr:lipopolysaccharide transport periplasmic protein LptA [Telluria sp.]